MSGSCVQAFHWQFAVSLLLIVLGSLGICGYGMIWHFMSCLDAQCPLFSYPVMVRNLLYSHQSLRKRWSLGGQRVYKFPGSLWPKLPHAATVQKEADGIDITGRMLSDIENQSTMHFAWCADWRCCTHLVSLDLDFGPTSWNTDFKLCCQALWRCKGQGLRFVKM